MRSMLVGAPLLLAQTDINETCDALAVGEDNKLNGLDLVTRGTAAHFIQTLSRASPRAVLRLVNRES